MHYPPIRTAEKNKKNKNKKTYLTRVCRRLYYFLARAIRRSLQGLRSFGEKFPVALLVILSLRFWAAILVTHPLLVHAELGLTFLSFAVFRLHHGLFPQLPGDLPARHLYHHRRRRDRPRACARPARGCQMPPVFAPGHGSHYLRVCGFGPLVF